MTIYPGNLPSAWDVLNVYHHGGNVHVSSRGTIRIPVYINNATGNTNVSLALWGKKSGDATGIPNHGASEHTHTATSTATTGASTATVTVTNAGNYIVEDTDVPRQVQIFIDDTAYANIGDPNGSGTSMVSTGATFDIDTTQYQALSAGTYELKKTFSGLNGIYQKAFADLNNAVAGGVQNSYVEFTYDGSGTAASNVVGLSGVGTSNEKLTVAEYTNPNPESTVTTMKFYINETGSGAAYFRNLRFGTFWGVDGSTEWESGWMDLSSTITWTAGWHYIDLKVYGWRGGTLIYQVSANTGIA